LVEWSTGEKRFVEVEFNRAKRNNIVIPEGWYAPLKNPAMDGGHPNEGAIADLRTAKLMVGKKVNIAGPEAFALWPGQMCKVIEGHKLRSNQYLLVRIYDVEAFRTELSRAKEIEKTAKSSEEGEGDSSAAVARKTDIYGGIDAENLATGQQFIIKGTDVHFYIPPDGIEVVATQYGDSIKYVQEAVTLEQLQYCILQGENGEKRYVRGPAVVFPEPTEKFLKHTNTDKVASKKFTAIELNEKNGLYIKVIKSYTDDTGETHREGDELFITGAEQKIYFPREEHAIIRYGDQDRHFGVALPKGEGRYVLDRVEGKMRTEMGPQMFLPDPRSEVIVKRILSEREAKLIYPGNAQVASYNSTLRGSTDPSTGRMRATKGSKREQEMARMLETALGGEKGSRGANIMYEAQNLDMFSAHIGDAVEQGVMGDSIDRGGQFSPPRSITLDSKFDGVVAFNVWNGFAVMIVDREGNRRVVEGPRRVYLEYDETPEVLRFSKGRPKNHDNTEETVFLRVRNNVVGDIMHVETRDLCGATVKISMHVDFVGEEDEDRMKWFSVDNYIKLLCERVGSLLKNHIRKMGVMQFYSDSTNVVRDIILGEKTGDDSRPGLLFEENGMVVSDVEVLDVILGDRELEKRLEEEASDALNKALSIEKLMRSKSHDEKVYSVRSEMEKLTHSASMETLRVNAEEKEEQDKRELERKLRDNEIQDATLKIERERKEAEIAMEVAKMNAVIESDKARLGIQLSLMEGEAEKTKEVMSAISPDLVAALSALGDNDRIAKLAAAVSPQAVFSDEGLLQLMTAQFKGLGFGKLLDRLGLKALPDAAKIDAARAQKARKGKKTE
jgi:major vault protein